MVNLLSIQKPSRYINHELNSVNRKEFVHTALAFPDVYEVGMSHLGLKILYHIINSIPHASAERVFSPWLDMEEALRKDGTPLCSLESGLPLRDFDIVGFSLQYELAYPTVLNMMDLGGIPVRTEERIERDDMPLIIAGGPCTINPQPMAPFIDAFLIGDGEEAVGEIIDVYLSWKGEGSKHRGSLLAALAEVEGVFVPSAGRTRKVRRRFIPSLEEAPFPDRPVVPFTEIIHDRINIEIARGCSQGCRFCQAGMICRPVRERSPEKVLELAERSLKNTGYDSVSFTSLSAGDYSCLHPLLRDFNRKFGRKRIAMSLPSLRVAAISDDILREIRSVRKTGFTIAPEAGTARLRAVINKDFTEDDYLTSLETLFTAGWHSIKLYFMIGLPTETDEDLAGIVRMVNQASRISKKLTGRHANINVGVSSFIPKPHTPFQWTGQDELKVLREKTSFIRREVSKRSVKYKGHDVEMSLIEAFLSRGDERLAGLVEEAWRAGCRLDAWTEAFRFDKWLAAMEKTGIDAAGYAQREYAPDEALPWENIETGISREFLLREYRNALSEKYTRDCRQTCHACGLQCPDAKMLPVECRPAAGDMQRPAASCDHDYLRCRLEFSKRGTARYLSHLELMNALTRAMRRAGFPFRYSGGFHPAPRLSFGPALRVGVAGLREYLDVELCRPADLEMLLSRLGDQLPPGLTALRMQTIFPGEKSLDSFIVKYLYDVRSRSDDPVRRFQETPEVLVQRKDRSIDLKKMVDSIQRTDEQTIRLALRDMEDARVRLDEVFPAVFGVSLEELDVTRVSMFGWSNGWREPIVMEKE